MDFSKVFLALRKKNPRQDKPPQLSCVEVLRIWAGDSGALVDYSKLFSPILKKIPNQAGQPELSYILLLKIWASDFGRDSGWTVKKEDQEIAILTGSRYHDMFWETYDITFLPGHEHLYTESRTWEFWDRAGITFVNREFPDFIVPKHQIVTIPEPENEIVVRGLSLPVNGPDPDDKKFLRLLGVMNQGLARKDYLRTFSLKEDCPHPSRPKESSRPTTKNFGPRTPSNIFFRYPS